MSEIVLTLQTVKSYSSFFSSICSSNKFPFIGIIITDNALYGKQQRDPDRIRIRVPIMVRVARFERAASCSQGKRPTPGLHPDKYIISKNGVFLKYEESGQISGQRRFLPGKCLDSKRRKVACIKGFRTSGNSEEWEPTTKSQSWRAASCATPGYSFFSFCRCGQTCGQRPMFEQIAERGKCGNSSNCKGLRVFGFLRLVGGVTRSQSTRATNCATPG